MNLINSYFTNLGPNLVKKLPVIDCPYDKACNVKSIENIPLISLKEVIDLAKNIKMFKSSGMNNISSRLVKDTILAIPEQITYLFNASNVLLLTAEYLVVCVCYLLFGLDELRIKLIVFLMAAHYHFII